MKEQSENKQNPSGFIQDLQGSPRGSRPNEERS